MLLGFINTLRFFSGGEAKTNQREDAASDESNGETIPNDGKDLSKSAQSATSLRAGTLQGAINESLVRFRDVPINRSII